MPNLPVHLSIIDGAIVAFFVFQILWGAKLGFALATFSLAGEILGLVAGVLYAPSLGKILDTQFHLVNQVNVFLAQKTQIPSGFLAPFAQTLFDGIIFFALFFIVSTGFFFLGKFIHGQVGVRRITFLSNSFFGMFIGALKAVLEVTFFMIAWNMTTRDPMTQAALQNLGSFSQFGSDSYLLPLFQLLVPTVSPFAKFF